MIQFILALIFGFIFILQTTFFRMFGSYAPDTMLLIAVYCGLKYLKQTGFQVGLFVGLIQDVFSYGLLGINMLTKCLAGFGVGRLREAHLVDPNSTLTWIVTIFFATVSNEIIFRAYFTGFYDAPFFLSDLLFNITLQSILNIVLGIPMFLLLNNLLDWLRPKLGYRDY